MFLTRLRFYFVLTVGDEVLPLHPYREGALTMDIPYLIGRTNDEGGYSMSYYHHPNFLSGLSEEEFKTLLVKTARGRGLYDDATMTEEDFAQRVIRNFAYWTAPSELGFVTRLIYRIFF